MSSDILAMVINLERRLDRRDYMQGVITGLGFHAEFIVAVDGKDPNAIVRMGPNVGTITGNSRSRLDYACVSSHYKCWERLVSSGHEFGLVLEDDVILSKDFADLMNVDWLPTDADIVKLETTPHLVKMNKVKHVASISRDVGVLSSLHMGAAAYIIARNAAQRLLSEMPVPTDQIDWILFCDLIRKESGFKIYQVNPAPAIQGMYHSQFKKCDWAESSLEEDRISRGIGITPAAGHNAAPKEETSVPSLLAKASIGHRILKQIKKFILAYMVPLMRLLFGKWIGRIKFV